MRRMVGSFYFLAIHFSSSGSFSEGWRSQTVAMIKDISFKDDRLLIEKFLTDGPAAP
jgi:hypothetical protein